MGALRAAGASGVSDSPLGGEASLRSRAEAGQVAPGSEADWQVREWVGKAGAGRSWATGRPPLSRAEGPSPGGKALLILLGPTGYLLGTRHGSSRSRRRRGSSHGEEPGRTP